jgi:hypothetical protein
MHMSFNKASSTIHSVLAVYPYGLQVATPTSDPLESLQINKVHNFLKESHVELEPLSNGPRCPLVIFFFSLSNMDFFQKFYRYWLVYYTATDITLLANKVQEKLEKFHKSQNYCRSK